MALQLYTWDRTDEVGAEAWKLVPVPVYCSSCALNCVVLHWCCRRYRGGRRFFDLKLDDINQYRAFITRRVNSSIEFGKSLIYHISHPIRAITIDWQRLCLWSSENWIEYLSNKRTNSNYIDCLSMDSQHFVCSFIRSLLPCNNDLDCNEGRHSFKKITIIIIMKKYIAKPSTSFSRTQVEIICRQWMNTFKLSFYVCVCACLCVQWSLSDHFPFVRNARQSIRVTNIDCLCVQPFVLSDFSFLLIKINKIHW